MYDYSKFIADLSANQAQFGAYMGPKVTLYLFSPKLMPTQVLRPYTYNFTEGFLNDILSSAPTLQEAVAPNGAGFSPNVTQAILPQGNGLTINTYELSNTWSFVLAIDDSPINHGIRHAATAPETRFIGSGYIAGLDTVSAEEPVNPLTNTINPRAVLVFTHATITYISNEIGMRGNARRYSVSHDSDLINFMTAQMATEQLYIGTPGDIRTYIDTSSPEGPTGAYGNIALTAGTAEQPSRYVSGILKSPKHQLNTIMHTFDAATTYAEDDFVKSAILPETPGNRGDTAKGVINQSLPGSNYTLPKQGIDTSRPITLQQLAVMYPNININPIKIPNQSEWGVCPQDYITKRNTMCSMVASTISSVLPGCGLANISFRYNSWIKSDQFLAVPTGQWELYEPIASLALTSQEELKKMVHMFKLTLENELFPVLKAVGGEFDLMAVCNLTGEILLDLNYNDDHGQIGAMEGWYETNGRLGGLINPMICRFSELNNNAAQLEQLTNQVIFNKLGRNAFTNPLDPMEQMNQQPNYNGVIDGGFTPPFADANQMGNPNAVVPPPSLESYTI